MDKTNLSYCTTNLLKLVARSSATVWWGTCQLQIYFKNAHTKIGLKLLIKLKSAEIKLVKSLYVYIISSIIFHNRCLFTSVVLGNVLKKVSLTKP